MILDVGNYCCTQPFLILSDERGHVSKANCCMVACVHVPSLLCSGCSEERSSARRSQVSGGTWWIIGRFGASRRKSRRFEFRSSRHVETLGKSSTPSCQWRSALNSDSVFVLCRGRLWVVVDLKRRCRNSLNE